MKIIRGQVRGKTFFRTPAMNSCFENSDSSNALASRWAGDMRRSDSRIPLVNLAGAWDP